MPVSKSLILVEKVSTAVSTHSPRWICEWISMMNLRPSFGESGIGSDPWFLIMLNGPSNRFPAGGNGVWTTCRDGWLVICAEEITCPFNC